MVRQADVAAALEVLQSTELDGGEVVHPDADDIAVLVDANYPAEAEPEEAIFSFDEEPSADETYEDDGTDVEVLARSSDWGPRVVGIVGVAALAAAIAILIAQAD